MRVIYIRLQLLNQILVQGLLSECCRLYIVLFPDYSSSEMEWHSVRLQNPAISNLATPPINRNQPTMFNYIWLSCVCCVSDRWNSQFRSIVECFIYRTSFFSVCILYPIFAYFYTNFPTRLVINKIANQFKFSQNGLKRF